MNTTGWVTLIGAITACITAAGGLIIAIIKLRNANATVKALRANSRGNGPAIPPSITRNSTP